MARFPKPIIGLTGGIGAGKSTVAAELAKLGCAVLDSDQLAAEALRDAAVAAQVRRLWGEAVFRPDGTVDRAALAGKVFHDPEALRRLNRLLHPRVARLRLDRMRRLKYNKMVKAVVWDSPLLVESGLHEQCDAVIFVEAGWESRLQRVARTRGWNARQLREREKFQLPLDKKAQVAQYIIHNDGDAALSRDQVRDLFSRILTNFRRHPPSSS